MKKFFPEIFWGILAASGLLGFYLAITKFTGMQAGQIWAFWLWILMLMVGFGVQVGLYTHLRSCHPAFASAKGGATAGKKGDGKVVAASGGMSGAAMVACCAHHLVDVLPILGLSAAAVFLAQYQTWFLALGVVSNILGIGYMVKMLKRIKPQISPWGGY